MKFIVCSLGLLGFAAAGTAFAQPVPPSEVAFDEYGAVSASLTGKAGDAASGEVVVVERGQGNCLACHRITALDEFPFHGEVGPPLDGAGSRWSEAELRGLVADAKMTFEGTIMPSFYKNSGYVRPGDGYTGDAAVGELEPILGAQDVENVVAFLMTLKDE